MSQRRKQKLRGTAEPEAEKMLCFGDLAAYGLQPVECVQWAMKNAAAAWLLQGNHDHGVAQELWKR
ncbi:MAG: hypothetical protein WB586_26100 [Chthoniobacterales bacterium]